MSTQHKIGTCIITFILLVSIFSSLIVTPKIIQPDIYNKSSSSYEYNSLGDEEDDTSNVLRFNPFKYIGQWEYPGEEPTVITGDISFNLYFSSTIIMRIFNKCLDDVKISVYLSSVKGDITAVEKGQTKTTPNPKLLKGAIQEVAVKLEGINQEIKPGESLIFIVEIIPSEKPIYDLTDISVERVLLYFKEYGENLNNSEISLIKQLGSTILDYLAIFEEILENLSTGEFLIRINVEDLILADILNPFLSSKFYFGSESYTSSIEFSTDNNEKITLYFQYFKDEDNKYKVVSEDKPTDNTTHSWPPTINLDNLESILEDNDLTSWIISFLIYLINNLPDQDDLNIISYYLHSDSKMDTSEPLNSEKSSQLTETPIQWTGPNFERNKIIENISAELFIYLPKIFTRDIGVKASIVNNNIVIAEEEQIIPKNTLIQKHIFKGPDSPMIFTFDNFEEKEILFDSSLTLNVQLTKMPILNFLQSRSPLLFYDSMLYPSKISFKYRETENIKLSDIPNYKIIPGGNAEIFLNITSTYSDTLKIELESYEKTGEWDYPKEITRTISENGSIKIPVNITSLNDDISAYDGDEIKLFINVSGTTGFDSKKLTVDVNEDAVDYDIEVLTPNDKKIKHGTTGTYKLIIRNNNTGYLPDTYKVNISSENGWLVSGNKTVKYYVEYIYDLPVYNESGEDQNEAYIFVDVSIPWYTEISSDVITFTITSQESINHNKDIILTVNVTTEVIQPDIFEEIYHFFESAAKKIGLDDALGSLAAWFLIFILIFLLLILIIIVIVIIKRKYVEVICLERIKYISPDESATYQLTILNPNKKQMIYDISLQNQNPLNKWYTNLDSKQLLIEPKQSKQLLLTVKPTDKVSSEDFIEVKVIAKPINKNKKAELSTVTLLKDTNTQVKISGVFHWPRVFNKDNKVTTSFKLYNKGNVSAENISIILLLNGEERNRVENITIPRGGYADIEIPWIAVKGKNEINIVVI